VYNEPEFITITVSDPKIIEENGKKQYTLYTITTDTNLREYPGSHFEVVRRYKECVWLKNLLHERLDAAREGGSIAAFPGNTVGSFLGYGRFAPDFIEERRAGLQDFLQSVANHIVTRFDKNLHTFLADPNFSPLG
jgi:hypothetical protein